MGISTQTITVDLSKQLARPQVVRLGQGDKSGTTLVADIYDNGAAYNLNGKTARFSMRAPDGASSYSVVASSYSGNKATFDIDETYAASIAGKTDTAYVEVLSGSTVICSTSRITVVVYRSASQGLPVSGAYSDALEEAISTFAEMQRAFADMQRAFADMQELVMPPATTTTLGGVIVGDGLDVASDGTLSFEAGDFLTKDEASETYATTTELAGKADAIHSHNASDITDGTLAVARGGTGVTTATAERERLGLGSTTGALPVANGGTGATTAPGARTNLGAASASEVNDLQDAVGTVDVQTDGDLQTQVDTLRDSVGQLLVRVSRTVTNTTFAANAVSYIYGDTLAGYAPIAMYFDFTNMSGYTSLVPSAAQTNGTNTYARVYNGSSTASTGSYVSTTIFMKV